MTHSIKSNANGILHSKFTGTIDEAVVDEFIENIRPYVQCASATNPIHFVADAADEGKWTIGARRKFTAVFDGDDRLGLVAVYNISRTLRIISSFMVKATGRQDSVSFFATRQEAMDWLQDKIAQPV